MKEIKAPGGTVFPSMSDLCTKLSYPNVKAECVKPADKERKGKGGGGGVGCGLQVA
jgi:hypothetical protein